MGSTNQCHCCLQRPPARDMRAPYTSLGISEVYSVMIEECFILNLAPGCDGKSGICMECVERLREACRFKLQVERCQARLLEWLEGEPGVKDEPVAPETEDAGGEVSPHEEVLVKVSSDAGSDEDCGTISLSSAEKSGASTASLSARAREQLTLSCSVRLERLRSDEAPPEDMPPHIAPTRAREQAYTCDTRGMQFEDKFILITHVQEHMIKSLGTNIFPNYSQIQMDSIYCCDMCNAQFTSKSILIRHIRAHKDPKQLTSKKNSLFHKMEKPYLCQQCNKSFKCIANLRVHEKAHSGVKPYECKECNKKFSSKHGFRYHQINHREVKPYKCKICDKQFAGKGILKEHEIVHSGVKPYECKVCKRRFAKKRDLAVHERSHSGVKLFECKICKKRFSRKNYLVIHDRIMHGGIKPYECKVCNDRFVSNSALHVHVENKHEMVHIGVKPYECKACKRRFAREGDLVGHEKTHSGVIPYECKVCKKRFAGIRNLTVHERIHSGVKPYGCKECNKCFVRKDALVNHERTHSGVKPYECKLCFKRFSTKSSINLHQRTHSTVKPNDCKESNKRFAVHSELRKHQKTHDVFVDSTKIFPQKDNVIQITAQENPSSSNECTVEFSDKDSLDTTSHVVVKPYSCEQCKNQFTLQSEHDRHKRIHTNDKSFLCEICEKIFFNEISLINHIETHMTR